MKSAQSIGATLSVLAALAAAETLYAADLPFPGNGRVYNTEESGWLNFECSPPSDGLLTCTFLQTGIRQQTKPDEARRRVAKEAAELEASLAKDYKTSPAGIYDTPQWKELCATATDLSNALQGKPAARIESGLLSLEKIGAKERQDLLQWSSLITSSCASRSLDGMKSAIALSLDQEQRTCLIRSYQFSQTFKPQLSNGDFKAWIVADTEPAGDCGLINVSRLVPGKESWEWRYYARKVVTNPSSNVLLISCADLDEKEYLYDWMPQPVNLQCDYIKPD